MPPDSRTRAFRAEAEAFFRSRVWKLMEKDVRERMAGAVEDVMTQAGNYPDVCRHRGWYEALQWFVDVLPLQIVAMSENIEKFELDPEGNVPSGRDTTRPE